MTKTKSFILGMLFMAGVTITYACQGPAASYVYAESDTWAQLDPYLDGWIDSTPAAVMSQSTKDALHALNKSRRARVAHAISSIDPSPSPTPAGK